jgi:hypothetical protein
MWVAIVVFFVAGLIVAEVGRRGAAGTLPRNHIAGIRLPSTMRDDESWAVAHRAGGPAMIATGLVSAVAAGIAALVWIIAGDEAASATVLGAALLMLAGVLYSGWKGVSALRRRPG